MSRATKFAARDPGPAARLSGFLAHLRENGFAMGVAEAGSALQALTHVVAANPEQARRALRAVCAGNKDQADRFDGLFDAFWLNAGRVREKTVPTQTPALDTTRTNRRDDAQVAQGTGNRLHAPDTAGSDDADQGGTGRRVASRKGSLMKKDLRQLVDPQDIREAETVARQLGAALRDRRSRRRKAARRGTQVDFRRTIRRALAHGGVPVHLARRERPDRPVKIVALCDVSGSMMVYARPFLAFLAGLIRADDAADAYLFHTRLTRIAEALRDPDPMRAINRVTLMADGIGGGTQIGRALAQFAAGPARHAVDGRTVVIILSDGYDSGPPQDLARALGRLKKRGCKIIWLNPMKGWQGYKPVARGMAAALPHIDHFAAANTLGSLAAIAPQLERL